MVHKFKPFELQYFNWIFNISPCFPVHSSKVNIITEPRNFYDILYERFKNAKRRISIASLYIGTGELEKELLKVTVNNVNMQKDLRLNILLDYQRGTRGEINSLTLYKSFASNLPEKCRLALYQTPKLQGSWSKLLPSRYNEVIGLQHIKLYIADNLVILSGANCSNDYFQVRQDRYIQIEDEDLANYYCELIDEVDRISRGDAGNNQIDVQQLDNKAFRQRILKFIEKWKVRQDKKMRTLNDTTSNETNTWIFPLIQMGEFGIHQDEETTCNILCSGPKYSQFCLATGYFNLTENYENTLLKDCQAQITLLMAHPNANGFLGAAGPAGGIPYAYSLIAKKFWQKVLASNQTSRVKMLEYERPGWTFHAKGLWYYPPGERFPWATVVGSANLGERSVRRDLEAQAAIFTTSTDLQKRLHEECSGLHEYASECSGELLRRTVPLWVRGCVQLLKTYF